MAEQLEIVITADTKNAEKNIGGLNKTLGGLSGLLSGALRVGLAAGAIGFGVLASGIGFSVSQAMEAQEVMAQTNAVIKSTGGIAGITAEAASDLALSLSEVTRFGDEAIQSGENILLTFTNIGEDIFPQATETILDMSQALGQDLQSSAIQLGKALQSPIDGVSALRRVGVNFTDDQQELIKSLVESGDAAEAQAMILRELQTEFGGSAEAAGQTFGGQIDILKNKISNLAETIGTNLLTLLQGPLGTAFTALNGVLDQIGKPGGPIDRVFGAISQFILDVQNGMSPIEAFRSVFGEFIPPELQETFNTLLDAFRQLELLLRNPEVQTQLKALGKAFLDMEISNSVESLKALASAFLSLASFLQTNGPAIATILGVIAGAFNFLSDTIKTVMDFAEGWGVMMNRLFRGDLEGAFQALIKTIRTYLDDVVGMFTDAPHQAVQGFIDGINAMTQPVRKAMIDFANEIEASFKDALGIHSPSAVFAELGKYTMQGLTLGINANAMQPQMAMGSAAAGMVSTAYSTSNQQNIYNPQIYPQTMIPSMSEVMDQLNIMAGRG